MASTMAKDPKKKPKSEKSEETQYWALSLKLDLEYEKLVEDYINSPNREHPPSLKNVFQRALKLLKAEDDKMTLIRKKMEQENEGEGT